MGFGGFDPGQAEITEIDHASYLGLLSQDGHGLLLMPLPEPIPAPGASTAVELSSGFAGAGQALVHVELGGQDYFYHVGGATAGLQVYEAIGGATPGFALTTPGALTQGAGLEAGSLLAPVTVGSSSYLLAAEPGANRVSSFALGPDGTPEKVSEVGASDGLGIHAPSALVPLTVGGQSFVLLAASTTGSISVLEQTANGALRVSDHIVDQPGLALSGVTALATAEHDGRGYVVAGGHDAGISLFELLPGGRLLHLGTEAASADWPVGDIRALEAVFVDDALQVFAATADGPGLWHLSLATGPEGTVQLCGIEAEYLRGSAFDDLLVGGDGRDTLDGDAGDDVIRDGGGRDWLKGGIGADTFVLSADDTRDTIADFEIGLDRLDLSDWGMLYHPSQLDITPTADGAEIAFGTERLTLISADGTSLSAADFATADILNMSRFPLNVDQPDPLPADFTERDVLVGDDKANVLRGYGGNDRLEGWGGADELRGGDGHDELLGHAGDDVIHGGAGNDHIAAASGNDIIDGGPGKDTMGGGGGDDFLVGGDNSNESGDLRDNIWGGPGYDTLYGGAGKDNMSGGWNDDTLYGGIGNDTMGGSHGNDFVAGEEGHDSLGGGIGTDTLLGGEGNDTLGAGEGDDWAEGGAGDDFVAAGDGHDRLIGGPGFDTLNGGAGDDTMTGGADRDRFIILSFNEGEHDWITDFTQGEDRIRLPWVPGALDGLAITGAEYPDASVVSYGGHMITVFGIEPEDFELADFHFV